MFINMTHIAQLFSDRKTQISGGRAQSSDDRTHISDGKIHISDGRTHISDGRTQPRLTGFIYLSRKEFFYRENASYKNDYLYVVKDFHAEDTLPPTLPENLVLFVKSTDPMPSAMRFLPDVNGTLLYVQTPDLMSDLDRLESFFAHRIMLGSYSNTLLDSLFCENSLQKLVDASYPVFQNPVFIFDAAFYLLAANWEEAKAAGCFSELLRDRWVKEESFSFVNHLNNVHKRVMSSEVPLRVRHKEQNYEQLICPVSPKRNLGHISLCAVNRPILENDKELLLVLRNAVYQQLERESFVKKNRGMRFEYFICDIIEQKLAIDQGNAEIIDYFRPDFTNNIYCGVVEIARSAQTINTFHIQKIFENAIPGLKSVLYDEKIILLIQYDDRDLSMPEKTLQTLQDICIQYGLYLGLSNRFFDILQIRDYYLQALNAIRLGAAVSHKPGLFEYDRYYLSHAISVFGQSESLQAFCHPKLKILLDYDQKHKTDLAKTLYYYLIYERNAATTASMIKIHRNTLANRLKQIDDIVSIDYENPKERQYLIMSYDFKG